MTDAEKETVVWLRNAGVKCFALIPSQDGGRVDSAEFWDPPPAAPAIDVSAVLSAPITEEEAYGYEIPEHLKSADDES